MDTSAFKIDLAKIAVEVPCPQCQKPIKVILGQIQREETVTCPNCGKPVKLHDKDKSTNRGIREVNQALDDLKKTVEGLGR